MTRHSKGNEINGWLIIDKPRDMGSTDVVSITRRIFNAKKNGHTGTLDPFATGVLPIAFGEATKLISLVMDGRKEYEFIIKWGVATSTDDTEGEVIETCDKIPDFDEIQKILPKFVGEIEQTPPVYSAIKINGQRAYDLARKGEDVDMPSRNITIYGLEFLESLPNNMARFRVECSKGTYIRTLGKDIALRLGTVGHLQELRRTKCADFSLKDTISLEVLKNIVHIDEANKVLLPMITSLCDITVIAVTEVDAVKLKLGQSVSPKAYDVKSCLGQEVLTVFENKLVAIARIEERRISPVRVFNY